MSDAHVIFLSIPGLRQKDVAKMPHLAALVAGGSQADLYGSFPCVTWPAQANMLTGKLPTEHGVVANGFYWRDSQQVEMWTAWNEKIEAPQVWDLLKERHAELTCAVWFPMLSKGCGAEYVCMPAPIHNPDGSESLWCYTKPTELYGDLRDALGHFPLKHFWGPLASIASTEWIVDSAVIGAQKYQPHFFYLYLPHLDYAAQKFGPDSAEAAAALEALDRVIQKLATGFAAAYAKRPLTWLVASEYTIQPVDHVTYPNRRLREAGLLNVKSTDQGEFIDFATSSAWALVDHQFSHVYVRDADESSIQKVVTLFAGAEGIAQVVSGAERSMLEMDHPRAGEVILVSEPNSWQAYYYWLDDELAPSFARTVDIHQKPGYDPVELFFDRETMGVPLNAELVRGSHGVPVEQGGVLLSNSANLPGQLKDTDVAELVLGLF
jgi:hypothetical protein